jgi:hypothetical protein
MALPTNMPTIIQVSTDSSNNCSIRTPSQLIVWIDLVIQLPRDKLQIPSLLCVEYGSRLQMFCPHSGVTLHLQCDMLFLVCQVPHKPK